jgi:NAD(P)-dependent dehydrogenase (short-subunit alcohol dehydrogenase family)
VARQRFDQMSVDTLMQVFKINVCGTLMVYQKLLNLVLNSQDKLIVTISSKVGSITENEAGMAYSYRASKAALNATMKSLSIDYKDQGLRVVVFHPGHVKTDMGGENAPITVEDSISGMKNIIKDLKTTGCFYDNFGETIAW